VRRAFALKRLRRRREKNYLSVVTFMSFGATIQLLIKSHKLDHTAIRKDGLSKSIVNTPKGLIIEEKSSISAR
jgi:hypothetical protein